MVEGQLRDSTRSIPTLFTQREPEYDQDTDLHQRESTQVSWSRRDGRREPDSGRGYTQYYRLRWKHENLRPSGLSQSANRTAGGPQT